MSQLVEEIAKAASTATATTSKRDREILLRNSAFLVWFMAGAEGTFWSLEDIWNRYIKSLRHVFTRVKCSHWPLFLFFCFFLRAWEVEIIWKLRKRNILLIYMEGGGRSFKISEILEMLERFRGGFEARRDSWRPWKIADGVRRDDRRNRRLHHRQIRWSGRVCSRCASSAMCGVAGELADWTTGWISWRRSDTRTASRLITNRHLVSSMGHGCELPIVRSTPTLSLSRRKVEPAMNVFKVMWAVW